MPQMAVGVSCLRPRSTVPSPGHLLPTCRAQTRMQASLHGSLGGPRPASSPETLRDPAHIGATSSHKQKLKEYCDWPLDTYMRLPVEQYYELDPNMIKPLGADRFVLAVPRIQLFNVWLEPEVEVQVTLEQYPQPQVVIQAVDCRLKGSDLVESFHLNRRFCLRFITHMTWDSPAAAVHNATPRSGQEGSLTRSKANGADGGLMMGANGVTGGGGTRNGQGAAVLKQAGGDRSGAGMEDAGNTGAAASMLNGADGRAAEQGGAIDAHLKLDVYCEMIPPFNLLPREVLEGTGNAVMRGLVHTLLPVFVRRLGADYQRWATDEGYRKKRQLLSGSKASVLQ